MSATLAGLYCEANGRFAELLLCAASSSERPKAAHAGVVESLSMCEFCAAKSGTSMAGADMALCFAIDQPDPCEIDLDQRA